jgi:hypothetical protein
MEYTKPQLNQLGVAETLVLGNPISGGEGGNPVGNNMALSAFEFEE